jgi:hypothetical protein
MSTVHHRRRLSRKTIEATRRGIILLAALGVWFAGIAVIDGIVWATAKLEGKVPGVHALVLRK